MRARCYSPELRRFANADIIKGEITNAITLNRYAYANGNPVSNVDPFGLAVEERGATAKDITPALAAEWENFLDEYFVGKSTTEIIINNDMREVLHQYMRNAVLNAKRPNNVGVGTWAKQVSKDLQWVDDVFGPGSSLAKGLKATPWIGVGVDALAGTIENRQNNVDWWRTGTDAAVDLGYGSLSVWASLGATTWATGKIGATVGTTVSPGLGTVIGIGVGALVGGVSYIISDVFKINGKTAVDWAKEDLDWVVDGIRGWFD